MRKSRYVVRVAAHGHEHLEVHSQMARRPYTHAYSAMYVSSCCTTLICNEKEGRRHCGDLLGRSQSEHFHAVFFYPYTFAHYGLVLVGQRLRGAMGRSRQGCSIASSFHGSLSASFGCISELSLSLTLSGHEYHLSLSISLHEAEFKDSRRRCPATGRRCRFVFNRSPNPAGPCGLTQV